MVTCGEAVLFGRRGSPLLHRLGGPDVYPRPSGLSNPERGVYRLYAPLSGTVPLGVAVQSPDYSVALWKRTAAFNRLVFQEEFNDLSGIDVDDTRKPGYNFHPKLAWGKYVLPKEHIRVEDGVLHLTNPKNNAQSDLFSAVSDRYKSGDYTGFAGVEGRVDTYFNKQLCRSLTAKEYPKLQ